MMSKILSNILQYSLDISFNANQVNFFYPEFHTFSSMEDIEQSIELPPPRDSDSSSVSSGDADTDILQDVTQINVSNNPTASLEYAGDFPIIIDSYTLDCPTFDLLNSEQYVNVDGNLLLQNNNEGTINTPTTTPEEDTDYTEETLEIVYEKLSSVKTSVICYAGTAGSQPGICGQSNP